MPEAGDSQIVRWLYSHRSAGLLPIPPHVEAELRKQTRWPVASLVGLLALGLGPCLGSIALSMIDQAPEALLIGLVVFGAVSLAAFWLRLGDRLQMRWKAANDLEQGTIERFFPDSRIVADLDAMHSLGVGPDGTDMPAAIDMLSHTKRVCAIDGAMIPGWHAAAPAVLSEVAEAPSLLAGGAEPPRDAAGDQRSRHLSAEELDELRRLGGRGLVAAVLATLLACGLVSLGATAIIVNGFKPIILLPLVPFSFLSCRGVLSVSLRVRLLRRIRMDLRSGTVELVGREDLVRRLGSEKMPVVWQRAEWLVNTDAPWTFDGVPAMWRRATPTK